MTSVRQEHTPSRASTLELITGWSAVTLVFAAPVSRTLFIAAGLLFTLAWVAEGGFSSKWGLLRDLKITRPMLLLSGIVLFWSAFSPAQTEGVIHTLKVYSKLPLVLMLITTLSDERWRQRAWWAFMAAMLLMVFSTYANVVVDLPWSRTRNEGLGQDHSVFIEHVSQSLMTTVFVAFCVHRGITTRSHKVRWAWIALAILSVISMVFLVQARSGLVALAVASTVLMVWYTPRKKLLWIAGTALLATGLLITASPLMRDRMVLAYSEVVNYKPFELTSLGARIDMWRFAFTQSLEHPVTGTGAGSYRELAAQHFGHCTWVCEHPHNQYLFFSMEYGLLGLAAFIWLLWRVGTMAIQSANPAKSSCYPFWQYWQWTVFSMSLFGFEVRAISFSPC